MAPNKKIANATIVNDLSEEIDQFIPVSHSENAVNENKDTSLYDMDTSLKRVKKSNSLESNKLSESNREISTSDINGVNLMTKRMTVAGGFLDIALFTANCEQLKFVIELGEFDIYYKHVLGLLITSLVLQLLVGLTMFLLGFQASDKNETYTIFLHRSTMGLVALITIVNIFISTFGPKGTVMARCLGAFAYPNSGSPLWNVYLNFTKYYMATGII